MIQSVTGLRRTFKIDIVVVFCTLIIATMAAITGFTYHQNRQQAFTLVEQVLVQTTESVVERTLQYLEPAQHLALLAAEVIDVEDADARPGGRVERFFIRALETYPQLGLVYFGDTDGNFLLVRRDPEGNAPVTRFIDRGLDPARETYHYRDRDGVITRRTDSEDVSYDPRVRPWFGGARDSDGVYWTDIYIFNTGRLPGITAAAAVRDGDRFTGTVAADLTLDQLSGFLESLQISTGGIAFLMDGRGQLIAFPGRVTTTEDPDGRARPLLASELDDPWVTEAVRTYQDQGTNRFVFGSGSDRTIGFAADFPDSFGKPWKTLVLVPEDDFLGPIRRTSQITLAISLGILLIAVYLGLRFARQIARPIEQLTVELGRIRDFDLGEPVRSSSPIREIREMAGAINAMKHGLEGFRRYVPADVVREMLLSGEEARPGGQERELTLMFTDIRDFTAIAEDLPARELMVKLSEYFDQVSRQVANHQGTLDKYIGDSVMAFWGAPRPNEAHALLACRAALSIQAVVGSLNDSWQETEGLRLPTRIGLHTGFSIVGNMGSSERLNYTALGDSVNLASRLEGVNRIYGTRIIISQSTYRYVRNECLCRPLDIITVKGKSNGVKIYELMADLSGEVDPARMALAKRFRNAFDLYRSRHWQQALDLLGELAEHHPDDVPVQIYTERCLHLLEIDPGPEWSGVTRLDAK